MNMDQLCVNTIRTLSADAIQKANSGHPGLPLGAAPMAYTLWAEEMTFNPCDPAWENRDRFILSAGHGSMLLYSLLHLFGYPLTMEDIRSFRQLGSKTPGHPEFDVHLGVETTTGPLGQGIANAVGQAMAEKHLAAIFNREGYPVVDHYTYVLTGDGCLEEGISGEASSLAGTLKLGKLILLYDCNRITIEGDTAIAFSENVALRYEAYGFQVLMVDDGNDLCAIRKAIESAKADERPSIIIINTIIGYGSPNQGSASTHGSPLGKENLARLKQALGFDPEQSFVVPDGVYAHVQEKTQRGKDAYAAWNKMMEAYKQAYPELYKEYTNWQNGVMPDLSQDETFLSYARATATRHSSTDALNYVAKNVPSLFGGAADVAPSTMTYLEGRGDFSAYEAIGSNVHFGIREHAMAAMANGMANHGGILPYVSCFFVFSDYMKASMRLSALMKLRVIYVLTHDSIGVGEDGGTHEPIEQLAMLRSIPGMTVFRPADSREVSAAYAYAVSNNGPTSIVLTRQNVPVYENSGKEALKGAYILSDSKEEVPQAILIATGSEVELAMKTQSKLWEEGIDTRVISMPSMEVFEKQEASYKEKILPKVVRARLVIEAAGDFGWGRYVGLDGDTLCMTGFGASAPAAELFNKFGFTVENAALKVRNLL